MYRKFSYILFIIAMLILFTESRSNTPTDEAIAIAQSEIYPYTLEELSDYDGEKNNPAYIVIDNCVYDVSDLDDLDRITEKYPPGEDVSEMIEDDPLREIIIEEAPEVGTLIDE